MDETKSTLAQRIARAAIALEQRRTGSHMPKSEVNRITGMKVREATAEVEPAVRSRRGRMGWPRTTLLR